jgi:hypothetical protein
MTRTDISCEWRVSGILSQFSDHLLHPAHPACLFAAIAMLGLFLDDEVGIHLFHKGTPRAGELNMVKGGRKAQLEYWKHYRQVHRDRDRLRKARKGIHYSRVIILGVKVQLPDARR